MIEPSQILTKYLEARDPAGLERQRDKKKSSHTEPETKVTKPSAASSAPAAPPTVPAPAPPATAGGGSGAGANTAKGGATTTTPETPQPGPDSAAPATTTGPPPARHALGKRIVAAFELRFHMLRCETHLKSGRPPALFPLSTCSPAALPVTRRCVRPLIAAAVQALLGAGEAVEGAPEDRQRRAQSLQRLVNALSSKDPVEPSITLLFNDQHPTLRRLLAHYQEDELPGCVMFSTAEWLIPVSPVVLTHVRNPDPTVSAREVDFSCRGRQTFRPAPATSAPSAGADRCSDPAVFVTASRGCFSLLAVPPKGTWVPEGRVWVADPGECLTVCGHDGRYVDKEDLYHPRAHGHRKKPSCVKEAEEAMSHTNSRSWTVAGHWQWAQLRAKVCVCVCVCVCDGFTPACGRTQYGTASRSSRHPRHDDFLVATWLCPCVAPTYPPTQPTPPPRPHPHTYVQHLWTLLHHYGSAQQLQRLARAKSIRRSLFDQILMAIAPDPKVWLCFVLRVCVGGGGGGGRGVYGTVRTEGPRLGTRTFLPPPPLPLCAQDIIVIGGAYSGRDRSAKGTKHPSILKARTQHVPVVVVSRQCCAACIVGDGGWGWGGGGGAVTTPPVLEGKLMHNMMTLHPASGSAGCSPHTTPPPHTHTRTLHHHIPPPCAVSYRHAGPVETSRGSTSRGVCGRVQHVPVLPGV